jgi:galactokinase
MNQQQVIDTYTKTYGNSYRFFAAPGRINIIGEHTDYNKGYVLPAAIDKCIYLAIDARADRIIEIISTDLKQKISISIDEMIEKPEFLSQWALYPYGVIQEIKALGHKVGGFNAVFGGDIPTGAGLSSSAAVECVFATAINSIFNLNIDKMTLAHICQRAEHNYAGVMCGIMDQFASIFGKAGHAIRLDCRSMEYDYFPIDIEGYEFILADTKVKHSLASSEYNRRKYDCEEGVMILSSQMPQVFSLRDVRSKDVYGFKSILGQEVFLRCEYVTEEIERVVYATQALNNGDLKTLGQLMYQSHDGLRGKYHVSCDELDLLVETAKKCEGVLGARMMGGGFGGCTINLVKKDRIDDFKLKTSIVFKDKFGTTPEFYEVNIGDGAREIVLR